MVSVWSATTQTGAFIVQVTLSNSLIQIDFYTLRIQFKGAGKFTVDDIDPQLCTHYVYAFAVLDSSSYTIKVYDSWGDIDLRGYSKFVGLKAQNPSLKMMISIGGWTDSTDGSRKYSKLVASNAKITTFVDSVLTFLRTYGFDGIDMDWEYPSTPSDKAGYAQLLRALRAAFNPRGYLLSVAVPANPNTANNGYDLATIGQTTDFVNVMTYVMHGPWEKSADHLAPLFGRPWDKKDNNVDHIVNFYLSSGLIPAAKMNLGIPLYGHGWTLSSSQVTPPAPAKSPSSPGPFTKQAGMLGYHEICLNVRQRGWKSVHDNPDVMGPYAHSPVSSASVQWVGYDDPDSAVDKSHYALSKGLGGVVVWEISTDDFGDLCGDGPNPMVTAIAQTILNLKVLPAGNKTTTTTTPKPSSPAAPIDVPTSSGLFKTTFHQNGTCNNKRFPRFDRCLPPSEWDLCGSWILFNLLQLPSRSRLQNELPGRLGLQPLHSKLRLAFERSILQSRQCSRMMNLNSRLFLHNNDKHFGA